jgi:APA family basic amino acid/polyamine antiporter
LSVSRYFIRKSVATIQAESGNKELKRTLTALNLVSLGIGCIIGAGIFVLTGSAAANHAGPAIILSFVLVGIACALVALCYAELASVLPVSGSAYTYAYATLGESIAWAMGWLLVLEYGLASATVAVGWSGYFNNILLSIGIILPPELTAPTGDKITLNETFRTLFLSHGYGVDAAGLLLNKAGAHIVGLFNLPAFLGIMAVTALLVIGISESAKVNNIIVLVKVIVVLLFVGVGAFYVDPANWHPFIPALIHAATPENPDATKYGLHGVLAGAGAIFFAYIGFESVSTAAQEAKNPQRDIPIGILGSLAICTVLYMMVAAVLTGIVPYQQLGVPEPIALAVDRMKLSWLSYLIKIGAIMGLSSVMLVLVYGQTRIFYMMGKDGLLPNLFCRMHAKFQTPWINTILVGICVGLAAATTPIRILGDLVSMGTLCAFVIVCFSVLFLRYSAPKLERPYRCPWVPVVPLAGIAMCLYLMYGLGAHVFIQLKWYFVVGILVYLLYGQFHSKLAKEPAAQAE